jgi:hypothetical protein
VTVCEPLVTLCRNETPRLKQGSGTAPVHPFRHASVIVKPSTQWFRLPMRMLGRAVIGPEVQVAGHGLKLIEHSVARVSETSRRVESRAHPSQ